MDQLTAWAVSEFVAVGGDNWRDNLTLGGIAVIIFLTLMTFALLVYIATRIEHK